MSTDHPPFLRIDDERPCSPDGQPNVYHVGKTAWDATGAFWRLLVRDGVTGWELVAAFKTLEPVAATKGCGHEMLPGIYCPKTPVYWTVLKPGEIMVRRCTDHGATPKSSEGPPHDNIADNNWPCDFCPDTGPYAGMRCKRTAIGMNGAGDKLCAEHAR
jgi:hypothetical protein